MRPHPSPSWAHRDFTARRLIRDAFAVRERLGDPRAVPGFRCSFLPDMPSSMTSGSSIVVSVQNTDVDIGLRHGPKNSALPIVPQSISRGARFSRLHWFATATACQVASVPIPKFLCTFCLSIECAATEALDGRQDVISGFNPAEWLGLGISEFDIGRDRGLEFDDGSMRPALDLLFGQKREEALDLIDPG